jgi:hypothetical protein
MGSMPEARHRQHATRWQVEGIPINIGEIFKIEKWFNI